MIKLESNNNLIKVLGKRIQNIRTSRKLTQEELASLTGKSSQFISEMERGIKKPNILTLIEVMKALNTTPNELLIDFVPSISNGTSIEIFKSVSELSEFDKQFLLKFIKDYKEMIKNRN